MRKQIIACLFLIFLTQLNYAQNSKFNSTDIVDTKHQYEQQSLLEILDQLALRDNIQLAYESPLLKDKFCKLDVLSFSLYEALDTALHRSDLEYQLTEDGQVLIRERSNASDDFVRLIGKIRDKTSDQLLPYTNISILGSGMGSYADSTGIFKLVIPKNRTSDIDTVVVSRIGYEDKKYALKDFVHVKEVSLEIRSRVLPYITILPVLERIHIRQFLSAQTISNSAFDIYSFGPKDILRKLQFLPSVAAHNDQSANLQIRGSESYETLILLDGITIYNPTHFYEIYSSINDNYIEQINFYKNEIPVNIRSMTGGVVEMKSYKPSFEKFSSNFNLNLADISGTFNFPISKKLSWSIALRKSILDQTKQSFFGEIISANQLNREEERFINLQFDRPDPSFDFFDINSKILFQLNDKQKIQLSFFKSADHYDDVFDQSFEFIKKNQGKNMLSIQYLEKSNWDNLGFNLSYLFNLNKNWDANISYSMANYKENKNLEINTLNKQADKSFKNTISEEQINEIEDHNINWNNNYQINEDHSLNFGIDVSSYKINGNIFVRKNAIYNIDQSSSAYTLYGSADKQWKDFKLITSMRFSYYTGTNKTYLDPSMTAEYIPNNRWSWYMSINQQHQYLRAFEYETRQSNSITFWSLADATLPILSATNLAFGTWYKTNNSSLNIELYRKFKNGVSNLVLVKPGFENEQSEPNIPEYRILLGDGKIWGLDLLYQYKWKKYQTQLAYTYSVNDQKFPMINGGEYIPDPDDSRHQVKWIQNYDINAFSIGLNTIYSSGNPYFDFSEVDKNIPRRELDIDEYINYLPDYFRIDASIKYNFKSKNYPTDIIFSVFNLTNRANLDNKLLIYTDKGNQSPSPSDILGSQTKLLSRTINLGLNIKI